MPETQTLPKTSVSTVGFTCQFHGGGAFVDPFGLSTEQFEVYQGKQHSVPNVLMFGEELPAKRARRYAHSRPTLGEIEYYEVDTVPELSADIAPESPPTNLEVPNAFRDMLVKFYFQRRNAALSGDETAAIDPPRTNTSKGFGLRSGKWIVEKEKDSPSVEAFLKALLNLRKRGFLRPTHGLCASMQSELDSFSKLSKGWNSYSAPAPTQRAIENAKMLVREADVRNTIPERVEPSAMGGVGMVFVSGDREVVVEFYNNGTAHALFSDDSTQEMRTRAVATVTADYRTLLDEVSAHLYGQTTA